MRDCVVVVQGEAELALCYMNKKEKACRQHRAAKPITRVNFFVVNLKGNESDL